MSRIEHVDFRSSRLLFEFHPLCRDKEPRWFFDEFLNEFVYDLSVDWIDTIILKRVFYWEFGEEVLHLEECLNLDGTLHDSVVAYV